MRLGVTGFALVGSVFSWGDIWALVSAHYRNYREAFRFVRIAQVLWLKTLHLVVGECPPADGLNLDSK